MLKLMYEKFTVNKLWVSARLENAVAAWNRESIFIKYCSTTRRL